MPTIGKRLNRGLVPLIEEVYETMRVEIENLPSYRIGRKYGVLEGEEKHANAVARRLLERDMAVEDIAEIAGLPLADVIRLRDEQASTPH